MPKSKKENIEIELDTPDGKEVFEFRPFGLHSFQRLVQKTTNLSIEEFRNFDLEQYDVDKEDLLTMDEQDLPPELREKFTKDTDESKFFSEIVGRCESHLIVDRDELREIINDPYVDDKKRAWAKQRIEDADYYMSDFTIEEQRQIVDRLVEDITGFQEGQEDAEQFRGD